MQNYLLHQVMQTLKVSQGNMTMPNSPVPPLAIKFCKHKKSAIANVNANNVNRSTPAELNKVSKPNSLHGVYSYIFFIFPNN